MSKKCMQRREIRRKKLFLKFKSLRIKNLEIIKNSKYNLEEKYKAQERIQKIPRDSSLSRQRRRCWKTGRGNGVYRKVGLCRNMFREHAMNGDIPGLRKSSW